MRVSSHHNQTVAIISPEFPPFTNWGGVATFNEELSRLLSGMGYDVHVISLSPNWNFSIKTISPHVTHHLIGFKTKNKVFNAIYLRLLRPLLSLALFAFPDILFFLEWNFFSWNYFRELHVQKHFVATHAVSYHSPALLIKQLFPQIPLIVHVQGPQEYLIPFIQSSLDNRIKASLESFFVKSKGNALVSCNQELYRMFLAKRKSSSHAVHYYIPNFVTPAAEIAKARKINKDNFVYWGRMEHRKGVEELLQGFFHFAKDHKNAHLWLIGSDNLTLKIGQTYVGLVEFLYSSRVPAQILERVHHIPRIDHKASLFSLASELAGIAIFPSLYEPFGFVYIEAMSQGLVTIGSTKGESVNLIDEGNTGFLVEPKAAEIAKKMAQIYKLSPSVLQKISKNAQKVVKAKFSPKAVMASYIKLYSDLGIRK